MSGSAERRGAPDERVRLPVGRAEWLTQTFVHWPYRPEDVRGLLPRELAVDAYDGTAWVSLTPFVMTRVRPPGRPGALLSRTRLSRLLTFPETNLRTYVRGPGGRDGLWFLDIEAGSAATPAARAAVGAPYHWADLSVTCHGGVVGYAGSRRGGGPSYRLAARPGDPLAPTPLDHWLTARWRAYTRRFGILWEVPVRHEPWPLASAILEELHETLLEAVGLPRPAGPPLVHYSPGVRQVRFGVPRLHRGDSGRAARGRSRPGAGAA
ncbi:DUF2071 domain-containing protein [Streptomyces sparsogenes]|uniref:YqjF family protein n=1 Tax=Streptomyces sparsogenes TaxID=67365 RepID=UPI003327A625